MKPRIWGTALLILGVALCNYGLWQLVQPTRYRAMTQIKIGSLTSGGCHDHVLEGEIDVIRSPVVLGRVCELKRDKTLRPTNVHQDVPASTKRAIALLNRGLTLNGATDTQFYLINIGFTDEDPVEAARGANAVAQAYVDFRQAQMRERSERGIKILQERFDQETAKVRALQSEVQSGNSSEQNRKDLQELETFRAAILRKIEDACREPARSIVQIVDSAKPPTAPSGPNRPLGVAMLVCGLVSSVVGLRLLFPKRSVV